MRVKHVSKRKEGFRESVLDGAAPPARYVRKRAGQAVSSLINITTINPATIPQTDRTTIRLVDLSRATTVPRIARDGAIKNGIENSRLSGRMRP